MKKTSATLIMMSASKKIRNVITSGRRTPSPKSDPQSPSRGRARRCLGRTAPGSGRRSVTQQDRADRRDGEADRVEVERPTLAGQTHEQSAEPGAGDRGDALDRLHERVRAAPMLSSPAIVGTSAE